MFHGIGVVRLGTVADPSIKDPGDALVRLTSSAICGTDLRFVRGAMMPGMKRGTILGHEGVGVVEEVGKGVRLSGAATGWWRRATTPTPTARLAARTALYGGPAGSKSS